MIGDVDMTVEEAEFELDKMVKFTERLQSNFLSDLNEIVSETMKSTADAAIEEYKKHLKSLSGDSDLMIGDIQFDPLKLMIGTIDSSDFSIRQNIKTKKVKVGKEWIKNTNRKIWKPWTWHQEKGHWENKYKNVKYINGSDMSQTFLNPVEESFANNIRIAKNYAHDQAELIAKEFDGIFTQLDKKLDDILNELKDCAYEVENKEFLINKNKEKLDWLEMITNEINAILEI